MEGGGHTSRGQLAQGHLALLYFFAFWSQFKPSEPFLVDYLVDSKGFTNHQVYQQVFALYVYARMPFNALVGAISEMPGCGARGVLAVGGACGLATAVITRFTAELWLQQAAQFTVAAAFSSRCAVFAVVFTLSPPSGFQRCIHTVRAVLLLSNCCSALLGEVLRDNRVPLSMLFDVDLVSQSLTLVAAILLLIALCFVSPGCPPSEAPRSREWVSVAEVAAAATAVPPGRTGGGWLARAKAPLRDLCLYFQLRCVIWVTVWGSAMDTAHGIVLTYWQNLLREKGIRHDHNGYLLASMYLAAALLTVVTRQAAILRGHTVVLLIGSMLSSAFLLCMVATASGQLALYCWLILFQCNFEVMTSVFTFQVGAEVTGACASGSLSRSVAELAAASNSKDEIPPQPEPRTARLTLLFSVTGILCGVTETVVQAAVSATWRTMEPRFLFLGLALGGLSMLLIVARGLEELAAWRWRSRGAGRARDLQAGSDPGRTPCSLPQAPLLPS